MLPVVDNAKAEQERIDRENEASEPKIDLDTIPQSVNTGGEVNEEQ